ncbi:MAG: MYXO-CTERM sorting domain-containing protein [Myxococcales bacterium]
MVLKLLPRLVLTISLWPCAGFALGPQEVTGPDEPTLPGGGAPQMELFAFAKVYGLELGGPQREAFTIIDMSVGTRLVVDPVNNKVYLLEGGRFRHIAGSGAAGHLDGPGILARFKMGIYPIRPTGGFGPDGTIYLAEVASPYVRALTPQPDGTYVVSTLVGQGSTKLTSGQTLPADQVTLTGPTGLHALPDGRVGFFDASNSYYQLTKDPIGVWQATKLTLADASGTLGSLSIAGVTHDCHGQVYMWHRGNWANVLLRVDGDQATRVAGQSDSEVDALRAAGSPVPVDGPVDEATFWTTAGPIRPDGRAVYTCGGDEAVLRRILNGRVSSLQTDGTWKEVDSRSQGYQLGGGIAVAADGYGYLARSPVNEGAEPARIFRFKLFEPSSDCPAPPPGLDAGTASADAGTPATSDAGVPADSGSGDVDPGLSGCGCSSAHDALSWLALASVIGWLGVRRRQRAAAASVWLVGLLLGLTLVPASASAATLGDEIKLTTTRTVKGIQSWPAVACAPPSNRCLVVFEEGRPVASGVSDVVAAVLDSSSRTVTREGLDVCSASDSQERPAIVSTPNGFLVAWQDLRAGDWDLWARWMDPSGNPLGTGEFALADGAGNQAVVNLAVGNGTVLATWMAFNGHDYDVRATELAGMVPATKNGVALAATNHYEWLPAAAAVGDSWLLVFPFKHISQPWKTKTYAQRFAAGTLAPLSAAPLDIQAAVGGPFAPQVVAAGPVAAVVNGRMCGKTYHPAWMDVTRYDWAAGKVLANPAEPAGMSGDWKQEVRNALPIPLGRDYDTTSMNPSIAAEGNDLVVVFEQQNAANPGVVQLARIDASTGTLAEWPLTKVAGDVKCAASQPKVAYAGPGLFLITYRLDCEDGGRIAARFLSVP